MNLKEERDNIKLELNKNEEYRNILNSVVSKLFSQIDIDAEKRKKDVVERNKTLYDKIDKKEEELNNRLLNNTLEIEYLTEYSCESVGLIIAELMSKNENKKYEYKVIKNQETNYFLATVVPENNSSNFYNINDFNCVPLKIFLKEEDTINSRISIYDSNFIKRINRYDYLLVFFEYVVDNCCKLNENIDIYSLYNQYKNDKQLIKPRLRNDI